MVARGLGDDWREALTPRRDGDGCRGPAARARIHRHPLPWRRRRLGRRGRAGDRHDARGAQRARHDPLGALARDRRRRRPLVTSSRRSRASPHATRACSARTSRGRSSTTSSAARTTPACCVGPTRTRSIGCSQPRPARCARSRSRPSTTARPTRSPGSSTPACASPSGTRAPTSTTALAAFDAGATILTHAFNGMRGIHHRAPGPVVAAMHADHVTLEIINDGVHVHPDVVRLAFAGAPGPRRAHHRRDGRHRLGRRRATCSDRSRSIVATASRDCVEGGSIAGSTLTQDEALRRAVVDSGIPLEHAVGALTETPAAAIGRAHDLGRLDAGLRRRRGAARRRPPTCGAVLGSAGCRACR